MWLKDNTSNNQLRMVMFRTLYTVIVAKPPQAKKVVCIEQWGVQRNSDDIRQTRLHTRRRKVQAYSKERDNLFQIRNELWQLLLLLFSGVDISLQVTLVDFQYLPDYEKLNSEPAQELISKFVAEVIIIAELPRARSGAPWVRKFGYDVAYARPYTHFM